MYCDLFTNISFYIKLEFIELIVMGHQDKTLTRIPTLG